MSIGLLAGGILILLVYGGTSYYIGLRLYQVERVYLPATVSHILLGIFIAASVVLVLRFFILLVPGGKIIKHLTNWVSSYWMGIYMYLLLFFAIADIVMLIGRMVRVLPSPVPEAVRLYTSIAAIVISAILVGYGIYHAGRIEMVSYEIMVSENAKAEELHIVLISDLHLGAITSEQKLETIVDKMNQMKPDVVCIAGDIFDSDFENIKDPEKAAETFRRLDTKYGVYCCLGNHDAGVTFGKMKVFLEKSNIRCLNEEYVNIDGRIVLLGRSDSAPIGSQGNYLRTDTKDLLDTIDTQLPVVVMDHNPSNLSQYTEKADLILCGHTHHGQVWPGNWVTKYGYYPKEGEIPQAIVTSGAGVWGLPMRIGSSCEIVSVRLK